MKLAGFLLMTAGWIIALAAVALLPPGSPRVIFIFAGIGVQALGATLAVRAHALLNGDKE